jgi:hypothetical protein
MGTMKHPAFPNRDAHEYARLLLSERKRELQALKQRHGEKLTTTNDYLSCRRSLLEAIVELQNIVTGGPSTIRFRPVTSKGSSSDFVTKLN